VQSSITTLCCTTELLS